MNDQNLRPLNTRSQRERKEIARMGAKAANKKRAELKTMRSAALAFLNGDIPMKELDGETGAVAITLAIGRRLIMTGDPAAYNALMTIAGEKPKESIELESNTLKGLKVKFVNKSRPSNKEEGDPKIVGEYTPATNTEDEARGN